MPQDAFYGIVERWYLNGVDGFIFNSSSHVKVRLGCHASGEAACDCATWW